MKLETERDSIEWIYAAKALAVVSAWNAVGAFEKLRAGPVAHGDLGIERRALSTTLPVVQHLGLIATDGERVALTDAGRKLVESGMLPTERNLESLRDLGRMREVLTAGGPVRDDEGKSKATRGGVSDDPARTARFLDMLYAGSASAAKDVLGWLGPKLPAGGAVLDVGGGHGRYARTFADAGFRATVLDLPHVVTYAKERHGDALSYIPGDFHALEDFGGPYDLVLFSNIVHGESYQQNAALVARAARALRPGGRVAIKDMFLDEVGKEPPNAVFFGLTMLFYTEHGESPSFRAVDDWFARAGLVRAETVVVDTQTLVCGRRAEERA